MAALPAGPSQEAAREGKTPPGSRRGARPYESPVMRQSLGCALRPGGLALTRRLLALSGLSPGARVLDAGCGQGASLDLLRREAGCAAVGLDPSSTLLGEAARRGPVLSGIAEALPFADGIFDAVLVECVLSLTADRDLALAECRRVLAPGGLLLLSDMYRKDDRPAIDPAAGPGTAGGCLDGAEPLAALFARLARAGFTRRHFENRDKDLRELAARLIFAHGSLEAFWEAVAGTAGPDGNAIPARVCGRSSAWPGYCCIIAQKDESL